jgi:transposase-like protein
LVFSAERARSSVHNGVDKADLQPTSGQNPDQIAVDETVIQLNDKQYWLYAAVDPEINKFLHTALEPSLSTPTFDPDTILPSCGFVEWLA